MPSIGSLVLIAGALLLGSGLNALVGFGFALSTVPLMALAVGPRDAVVLSAILGLVSNAGVSIRHREDVARPVFARMVAGALVGMPLGLAVLLVVPERWIGISIAVVVLAAVALIAAGWEVERVPAWADVAAGAATGVLNTSVGVSGPPVVTAMHGHALGKGRFRATAAAVFGANGVVAVSLFVLAGQTSVDLLFTALVALPAWPAGWWIGDRLHRRFPEERFRNLVLVLLACTALLSLIGAISS